MSGFPDEQLRRLALSPDRILSVQEIEMELELIAGYDLDSDPHRRQQILRSLNLLGERLIGRHKPDEQLLSVRVHQLRVRFTAYSDDD